MNEAKIRKQAYEILQCSKEKIEEKSILQINAMYFRNTDRGGAALIISDDFEMLFVDPFYVGFEEHLKRFINGERTEF